MPPRLQFQPERKTGNRTVNWLRGKREIERNGGKARKEPGKEAREREGLGS